MNRPFHGTNVSPHADPSHNSDQIRDPSQPISSDADPSHDSDQIETGSEPSCPGGRGPEPSPDCGRRGGATKEVRDIRPGQPFRSKQGGQAGESARSGRGRGRPWRRLGKAGRGMRTGTVGESAIRGPRSQSAMRGWRWEGGGFRRTRRRRGGSGGGGRPRSPDLAFRVKVVADLTSIGPRFDLDLTSI